MRTSNELILLYVNSLIKLLENCDLSRIELNKSLDRLYDHAMIDTKIFVLKDHKIVGKGSHESLKKSCAAYKNLYKQEDN